jgi:hypothetical protein
MGCCLSMSRLTHYALNYKKKTHVACGPTHQKFGKLMKTQHQNLEFGHKLGEIQNKPEKSTLEFQRGQETQKGINFVR